MTAAIPHRRQFLRGDFGARRLPIRPPWAQAESAFVDACTRCADCVPACPERLIKAGSGGFPELDFSHGGCSFCGACLEACKSGALQRGTEPFWSLRAVLGNACLTLQGVVCRSCGEHCETRAIRFLPQRHGVAVPRLDAAACTGCGACVGVCPAQALSLSAATQADNSARPDEQRRHLGNTTEAGSVTQEFFRP